MYFIPATELKAVLVDHVKNLLIPRKHSGCLAAPSTISLAFVDLDPVSRQPYSVVFSAEVSIEAIRDLKDFKDIQLSSSLRTSLGFSSLNDLVAHHVKNYGPGAIRGPSRLISIRLPSEGFRKVQFGAPLLHPRAETVTLARVRELQGQGATLIDVRKKEFFLAGSLPGALSNPIRLPADKAAQTIPPMIWKTYPLSYAAIAGLDHQKPIVAFGSGPASTVAYNFLTALGLKGFRQLFFFRGGYEELRGLVTETPKSVAGVETLTVQQARNLFNNRPVLIDTRDPASFRAGSIWGAGNLNYIERTGNDGEALLRGPALKGADLRATDGNYPLATPRPGVGQLIFYGQNEYDWAALKAAIQALELGYRNVGWIRGGFDEWDFAARLSPDHGVQKLRLLPNGTTVPLLQPH